LSAYKEEDERLFFGGAYLIRIESIAVIATSTNYREFFEIFFLFDAMLSGIFMDANTMFGKRVQRKHARILKHLIDCTVGVTTALSVNRKYDEYIYDCFRAFTQSKLDIVLDYGFLRVVPSYFAQLIFYSFVNTNVMTVADGEKANIPREMLLRLFPNVQKLTINQHKHHRLSFTALCSVFSKEFLAEHGQIQRMEIKAPVIRGRVSGESVQWTTESNASTAYDMFSARDDEMVYNEHEQDRAKTCLSCACM